MLQLVSNIFEQCRLQHLPMVQIRPKNLTEPDIYQGDFDLLIAPNNIDTFLTTVHRLCAEQGNHFVIKRHKPAKTNLVIWSKDTSHSVEFDIWSELDIRSKHLSKGSHISWATLMEKGMIVSSSDNSYSLSDDFAALFYLSHLKSKKKDLANPEVQSRLDYFASLKATTESTRQLLSSVDSHALDSANDNLVEQGLISNSTTHRRQNIRFRFSRNIAKKSRLIAVVGPDGVGKTTVIEQLEKITKGKYFRFKKLFRKSLYYKLLTKKLNKRTAKKYAKNQLDDLQCRKLFWISLLPGYVLSLKARFHRKTICDRYFSDLLIQGARFLDREVIIIPDAKRLIKIAPCPAVYIQLDAPSDVILARKQEVSAHAIEQFRTFYFDLALASEAPMVAYINTQYSIEKTKNAISCMGIKL